jgi:peptide/nickel transport system permease protein
MSPGLAAFWRAFRKEPSAVVGLVIATALLVTAAFCPWLMPQNPYDLMKLNLMHTQLPPLTRIDGTLYLLGTDAQGRDILSGVFYGLRISFLVAFSSAAMALVIGTLAGLIAAYRGGAVEAALMRLVDMQLSFPTILVALFLLAVFGRGVDKVIIALVVVQWAYYARTVRGVALSENAKDYVAAARVLRLPMLRVILRHVLPNCLPPVMVIATIQLAHAIMLEATLSFLGLGVSVTQPSLGLLISNGFEFLISGKYWISVLPGCALLLTILSLNLVADHLRSLFNPRLR